MELERTGVLSLNTEAALVLAVFTPLAQDFRSVPGTHVYGGSRLSVAQAQGHPMPFSGLTGACIHTYAGKRSDT